MTISTDGYSFVTALNDIGGNAIAITDEVKNELVKAITDVADRHGCIAAFRFPGEIIDEHAADKYDKEIDDKEIDEEEK